VKRVKILSTVLVVLFVIAIGVNVIYPLSVDIFHKITEKEVTYDVLPLPPGSFFKRYMFPLQVSAFTNAYGKPNDTYVDQNETCPIGQMHSWWLKDKNIQILVLGDDYESQINYNADCRLYAVRKCNRDMPTTFDGVWGIKLGDSDAIIKEKLEKLVKNNISLQLTKDSNGSPVHCRVIGRCMKHQYVLSKGDVFLFFMVGESGSLETIMFTEMDVRAAC